MNETRCGGSYHGDRQAIMSLALACYDFSTPEIRVLMRHVLGHAISGRTIKRLRKTAGQRIKRGRPPSTPKVQKGEVSHLIEATSEGLDVFCGDTLQFFHHIRVQFGLTPRQYFKWVAKFVRRGKCMMRRCLLCGNLFPSFEAGDRHCNHCGSNRRRLLKEEGQYAF